MNPVPLTAEMKSHVTVQSETPESTVHGVCRAPLLYTGAAWLPDTVNDDPELAVAHTCPVSADPMGPLAREKVSATLVHTQMSYCYKLGNCAQDPDMSVWSVCVLSLNKPKSSLMAAHWQVPSICGVLFCKVRIPL